jgi:5-methylcytosine-specific restriction enzyme A
MKEYKTKSQKAKFYNSGDWKRIRKKAMEINNYECQSCKRSGIVTVDMNEKKGKRKKIALVVHHIKELEHHPDLALDIENLEVQCVLCHNRTHEKGFDKKENPWKHDEKW